MEMLVSPWCISAALGLGEIQKQVENKLDEEKSEQNVKHIVIQEMNNSLYLKRKIWDE